MTWEYVAGFFDGEGCVSYGNTTARGKSYRYVSLIFTQSEPQEEVIYEIKAFLEGEGFHPTSYIRHREGNRRSAHILRLNRQDEVGRFADILEPLVVVKKEEVRLIDIPKRLKKKENAYA
jgi:hypothetical protein